MVINGRGTPAYGPVDILIEKDIITDMLAVDSISLNRYKPERPDGDLVLDAENMYVIPGIVNMHTHISFDNKCGPKGPEYAYKLSLAHGITTIRTCGFGTDEKLVKHREESNENKIIAPRIVVLGSWPSTVSTKNEAREAIQRLNDIGVDGIKMIPRPQITPEIFEVAVNEIKKLEFKAGLAIHIPQSSELDALIVSDIAQDIVSIEHTYGIPQAAIPGSQKFPDYYNYSNELHRFRLSGYIWSEAEQYPEQILDVLDAMIINGTSWNPTMVVYEANRDLQKARTLPWHERYTVPQVWQQFEPSPSHHASYHFDWTTSDEIAWKKKYQIWMNYVKYFHDNGGTLTLGEDTAFIYQIFGFAAIRELELFQEAGIHPIDVIKIGTINGAKVVGLEEVLKGVVIGGKADLAIINGNPLHNFKVMYGTGLRHFTNDGKIVRKGGVKWTIKNGVVFNNEQLLNEVAEYVSEENAKM
jgi:cytosine/adenosine deaminase-related metal-dependent hydrolase